MVIVDIVFLSRHSSVASDGPWTPPRMPTMRTRLRWWSVWTVWRRLCSSQGRAALTASRAGRRARPPNSPPPVWFLTTARGRWLMCSLDLSVQLKDRDCGQNLVCTSEHNSNKFWLSLKKIHPLLFVVRWPLSEKCKCLFYLFFHTLCVDGAESVDCC